MSQLQETAGNISVSEEVHHELSASKTRIQTLEEERDARTAEQRDKTTKVYEQSRKSMEASEESHREQYDFCMQRIHALTEQRDKVESERDEALASFTELEESLGSAELDRELAMAQVVSLNTVVRGCRQRVLPVVVVLVVFIIVALLLAGCGPVGRRLTGVM